MRHSLNLQTKRRLGKILSRLNRFDARKFQETHNITSVPIISLFFRIVFFAEEKRLACEKRAFHSGIVKKMIKYEKAMQF
jgi:hypothetical protein